VERNESACIFTLFAMAELLPPEVWKAIFILLKGAQ
jgi:hypothetical protein